MSPADSRAFAPVLAAWRPEHGMPCYLVRWFLTSWCNYDCAYCRQTHRRFGPGGESKHAFDHHSVEEWCDAFDAHFGRRRLSLAISGGEPTRQAGLVDAAREVRERGFGVGLHTAGAFQPQPAFMHQGAGAGGALRATAAQPGAGDDAQLVVQAGKGAIEPGAGAGVGIGARVARIGRGCRLVLRSGHGPTVAKPPLRRAGGGVTTCPRPPGPRPTAARWPARARRW